MFTDISGYTALMGGNESLAMEYLRINRSIQRPLIEEHGGEWLKEMGDGVLAMFDSALNAVKCAMKIQEEVRIKTAYKVRIGLHLGEITLENQDIFGDGVNIASRIESITDPGGIYVSESIVKAIRANREIQFFKIGATHLKNVSDLVVVYAIQSNNLPLPSQKKIRQLLGQDQLINAKRRRVIFAVAILVFAAIAWVVRVYIILPNANKISAIAVLPLQNLTGDNDQEYFVAGMHDALITELSRIGSIRVISRQSTLRYLGSTISMPEIAKQLHVDALVEGSVFKTGNHVRIQIQLIKARPEEAHILAQAYDRELEDILNMHKEITQDIAGKIEIKLTQREKSNLDKTDKVVPEAYEAYLKGVFYWNKLTPESLELADSYFKRAIEIDPDYPLAYIGMASIGLGKAQMGYESVRTTSIGVKAFMDKAYELDSGLAEWYSLDAGFKTWGQWKWIEAEKSFLKSIELNPNYSINRVYYAQYLTIMRRFEEGLEQIKIGLEIDPFNTLYNEIYCMNLLFSRRYNDAADLLNTILEKEPNSRIALTTLRSVYHQEGKFEEAYDIWKRTNANDPKALEALEKGYSEDGYSKALQRLAEYYIEKSQTRYVSSWQIGTQYTRAGMKEEALKYLELAFEQGDQNVPFMNIDPIFDYLREEPEFQRMIEDLNFPSKSE